MTALAEIGRSVSREFILDFERELLKREQVEMPVTHYFAPGMYVRSLFIPAGVCLTGAIHRHAHLNIIAQGDISVLTEDGVQRFQAPRVLLSSVGIKRVGYTHSDTTWITCHTNPTDESDIKKLEAMYVTNDYAQLERDEVKILENLCHSQ